MVFSFRNLVAQGSKLITTPDFYKIHVPLDSMRLCNDGCRIYKNHCRIIVYRIYEIGYKTIEYMRYNRIIP